MCPTSIVSIMQFQNIIGEDETKHPQMKRTRRPKKRKHRSVFETMFGDKQAPEKQTRRANKAKTAAPENTTQFIMADKEIIFPFPCDATNSEARSSKSVMGTPISERDLQVAEEDLVREFSELDFDFDFFQRDFNETYSRMQKETLLSLSKPELVERYQQLEDREDELYKQIRGVSGLSNSHPHKLISALQTGRSLDGGSDDFNELEVLRRKNKSLTEENCRLKALKGSSVSAVRGL